MMKLFAIIAVISAMFPLFGRGFIPTHDGEYHIIRFAEFYAMLREGYLTPRWAPNLNSGYGVPIFTFHYPFPNYVGSFFHVLGAGFVDSFKYSLAAGYLIAVLACYFWVKKLFGKFSAITATVIFAYIPYWFVELYVRGSIGEVFALAFIMLALAGIEYKKPMLLTLCIALTILSHNIIAMIFLPIVAVYSILRQKAYIWSVLHGVMLSCYFWLPAMVEQQYVTGLNIVNFRDHFPMIYQLLFPGWGTGFSVKELTSDEMSFQIGVVPMIIVGLAVWHRNKLKSVRTIAVICSLMVIAAVFFMLEPSVWIWERFIVLQFIQYPWRLLAWFLPIVAFFAGFVALHVKKWVMIGLCIAAVVLSYSYSRPVIYQPRSDAHYLTRREFTDGTSSMGNTFSTRWTTWKDKRAGQKIEFVTGTGTILTSSMKSLDYRFTVQAREDARIRVNTLYYPGWTVSIDQITNTAALEHKGVIEFELAKGTHGVEVKFKETLERKTAKYLSLAGLLWFGVSAILNSIYAYRNQRTASFKRT